MKHPRRPRWFDYSHRFTKKLDPKVAIWLNDQGSLTKRLIDYCSGAFSVRVLSQQWIIPQREEARLLGIPPRQKALLRQVQLLCDNSVCVYARSIIPLTTLKGKHRCLKRLGNKPLGGYLFAQPNLKRSHQHLASIHKTDPLFEMASFEIAASKTRDDSDQIWGRRSLFTMGKKPLLVSEFFLPALFEPKKL